MAGVLLMKTSIATVSIAGDFRQKLAAIAMAGFDGIEIFEQDFIGFESSPAEVGRMVRDHGLEIMLFQPFRDFEGFPRGPLRDRAFARARQKFAVMNALGTDLMLICSSVHPRAVGGIDRCADDLAELGDVAADFGVRVGYEALAWGRYVNDHRDAWEIVRRADHPRVGLILDSYHTLARGIDPDSIRSIPGDRIFFLQLADAPAIDMDLLYLSRHYRNMPGEGDLDLPAFMKAVEATGYDGPLSLEIFNDQFRRSNAHLVASDGHRALLNLRGDMTGTRGAEADPIPPASPAAGIRLVEIDVPPAGLSAVSRLLKTIGFQRASAMDVKAGPGTVPYKAFSQAGISIFLGEQEDDNLQAGPVIRSFGLEVTDVSQAMRRALALKADPVCAAGAAIRGVNQSIIGFVEQGEPAPGGGESAPGWITGFDHLSQTLAYDEMLSWSLFYTTIFGLSKSPVVDVVDPDGLVKSQVLANHDARVRIILNGSDGPQTQAASFASTRQGSAAHHVAFETPDVIGLAGRLAGAGIATLAHTQNYYDDLAARFGIDPEQLNLLRENNLMYDEDETGAFYQLYLPSFENGFFLEFVQRVDGYEGLGGPNAPYRLAAQRRLGKAAAGHRGIDQPPVRA